MKAVASMLFTFLCLNSFAQSWQWAKLEQSTQGEFVRMCTDPSGNVIMACVLNGTAVVGSVTITSAVQKHGIIKYDENGNFIWVNLYPNAPSNPISVTDVACDQWGNVFMTGAFKGAFVIGTNTLISQPGAYNVFLVKYDPQGNVLWVRKGGGNYMDISNAACTDALGNCYITGYTASSAFSFGNNTFTHNPVIVNEGNSQFFVVKYDANGNVVWIKTNQVGTLEPMAISCDINNNILITGILNATTVVIGTNTVLSNIGEYFVAKFHSNGSALWAFRGGINSGYANYGSAISSDPAGNFYVSGTFIQSMTIGTITFSSIGGMYSDAFIAKYDSSANLQWARSVGSSGSDYGYSNASYDGGVFFAGEFETNVFLTGNLTLTVAASWFPNVSDNMFLLHYDANGNMLSPMVFNGFGDDQMSVKIHNGCNLFLGADLYTPTITVGSYTLALSNNFVESLALARYNIGSSSPTLSINGALTICAGMNSTLSASGGINYSWNTGNSGNQIVVNPTVTSVYTVTGSDPSLYCVSKSTVTINVNPLPVLSNSGSNTLICHGNTATLTLSGANSYSWANGAQGPTITVSPPGSTAFTATGTDTLTACSATIAVQVTVDNCDALFTYEKTNIFQIYPNPACEQFYIEIKNTLFNGELVIYNELGEIIQTNSIQNGTNAVDCSHFNRGIYVLSLLEKGVISKNFKLAIN